MEDDRGAKHSGARDLLRYAGNGARLRGQGGEIFAVESKLKLPPQPQVAVEPEWNLNRVSYFHGDMISCFQCFGQHC